MERQSGVLMHISSLFGGYSIGSFSRWAEYFVDFLADCGFGIWQVLPFCMPDEYNSPYSSYSSFGANPYFIDLEKLNSLGLITDEELEAAREKTAFFCEFDKLRAQRIPLLKSAAKRARNKEQILNFCRDNPSLQTTAEFMAKMEKNGGQPWWRWRDCEPSTEELFFWQFIQYEFFRQWGEIKAYANSRGIKIIGDLPIYVSHNSSDVWQAPEEFMLGEDNMPSLVGGVPPDYFSEKGQLWHNPIYNFKKMKKNGFSMWRERIRHVLSIFDGVRLDHFRAFDAYWCVPATAEDARSGYWKRGPGRALIRAIREEAGDRLVIAEDLGDVTDSVEALRKYGKFPGMRVLQFGFLGEKNSKHLPHNYSEDTVAYTGTHDNSTLLGYVLEADEVTRNNILQYAGGEGLDVREGCERVLRCMLASGAGAVIFPIQDILGFGNDTRMNTPGIAEGNWGYRVTREQLDRIDRERWRYLNTLYARN